LKVYWHLVLMQLKSQMQYKTSFFLSVFGQFLTAFTMFFGLQFIFSRIDQIDDFTYGQVLLCFAIVMLAFSIGEMFGGGLGVFPRLIRSGSLDQTLIRPRSIILQVIAPNLDFTRLGILLQAVIVLIIAIPASGVVWNGEKALTLVLMITCGSILFFSLFLLYASCSFFILQGLQFMNIFTYGAREFGRYPFSVYGKNVLKFLTFVIPLAWFQYYPLLYLLNRATGALWMFSPLLSLLFLAPSYLFFRIGLRRYQSSGS